LEIGHSLNGEGQSPVRSPAAADGLSDARISARQTAGLSQVDLLGFSIGGF
jgi:hypothetical protein